jgi:Dehydratase medium subunit
MSEPLVLALVAADVPEHAVGALRAGFEEEGVPLVVESGQGSGQELARAAAARALLGIGVGLDPLGACAVLTAAPAHAYLQAAPEGVRAFAQDAARVAGRRPLRRPATWPVTAS